MNAFQYIVVKPSQQPWQIVLEKCLPNVRGTCCTNTADMEKRRGSIRGGKSHKVGGAENNINNYCKSTRVASSLSSGVQS